MNRLGKIGENTAIKYLEKMKYKILKTNYRNRRGEIDIIAFLNNILVIIEVKARSNDRYGNPIDAVNKEKVKKIKNCTNYYIYKEVIIEDGKTYDVIYAKRKEEIHG